MRRRKRRRRGRIGRSKEEEKDKTADCIIMKSLTINFNDL